MGARLALLVVVNPADYTAPWFPLTADELAVAFEAGLAAAEAREQARLMALAIAEGGGPIGRAEVGGFLDPVARLSEDAARRVGSLRRGIGRGTAS